jgi:hypothetical protein
LRPFRGVLFIRFFCGNAYFPSLLFTLRRRSFC